MVAEERTHVNRGIEPAGSSPRRLSHRPSSRDERRVRYLPVARDAGRHGPILEWPRTPPLQGGTWEARGLVSPERSALGPVGGQLLDLREPCCLSGVGRCGTLRTHANRNGTFCSRP